MKEILKSCRAKPLPPWIPWVNLTIAMLWFALVVVNVCVGNHAIAALNAACFAVFMIGYYANSRSNFDREVAMEIRSLKEQLDKLNDKSQQPRASDADKPRL